MSEAHDPGRMIWRGAQGNALGFFARLAGRLIFLFVASRFYGAQVYGAFVLAVAVVELAVSAGNLATKKLLFPLLDRASDAPDGRARRDLVLDASLAVVGASLLLAALIAVAASLFASPDTTAALIALSPMIAGQALLDLVLAALRWRGKVRFEILARSLIEPWFLASGAAVAYWLGAGRYGLSAGYWCGTLAALGYAAVAFTHHYPGKGLSPYRPCAQVIRVVVRGAGANSANDILNALYMRADIYLVGLLLGAQATGIYGMVRQLTTPLRQARQSFDSLLVPAISRTIDRSGAAGAGLALASTARLILVIQLPIFIAMVAVGQPLLFWIGREYEAGYHALLIIAGAEILQSALGVGDLIFVYLKPRIGLYLTLLSVATGVAAASLLIPTFGIVGAAISVILSYSLRSVLRFAILTRRFGIPVPHAHLSGAMLAAALALLPLIVIDHYVLRLTGSLAVYVALLYLWLRITGQKLALTGFSPQRGHHAEEHGAA